MEGASLILVDTQAVIWLSKEQQYLSKTVLQVITDARRQGVALAISDISLWECAMASRKDRLKLGVPLAAALNEIAGLYTVLPITPAIAETSLTFSTQFPRDPADRIIAATAVVHRIPLITSDGRIQRSGEVPCIW